VDFHQHPGVFEGGLGEQFDYTVAVTTPNERRRGWAEERGMGEEQRRAIEGRQLSSEEKARRADIVVENDGDLDKLREQAKALVDRALGRRGTVGESGAEEE
jgi:dephospho-CoA kinase